MSPVPENCRLIEYCEDSIDGNDALFRVHDKPLSREFLDLHQKMEFMDNTRYYQPKEGEIFAYCYNHEWLRAFLIRNYKQKIGTVMHIFLIDFGTYMNVEFEYRSVRALPQWFSTESLQSQSYKITIYGVIPVYQELQLHDKPRKKRSQFWLPYHNTYMRSMMKEADRIYFEQLFEEGEIKFGYIYLEVNRQCTTLQKLLLQNEMAIECSESDFEGKEIPLLVKAFRNTSNFDRELSVRKLLYPSLTFNLEEGTSTINYDNSDVSSMSALSNYSSYSNSSIFSMEDSSKGNEEVTCHQPENTSLPTHNEGYESDDSDQTSDYNSECHSLTDVSVAPVSSVDSRTRVEEECSFYKLDEILVIGNHDYFTPTPFIHTSRLDAKTREMIAKRGLRDLLVSQSYLIPAMLSRQDVVLIDAPASGKTVGCVMALVSLLRASNPLKKPGVSPRSLYIVPYSANCEMVRDRCVQLVTGKESSSYEEISDENDLRVTVAYGCGAKLEHVKLCELAVGYDIVVCTPKCLIRLLKRPASVFDLERLEYVVYDEYHTLSQSFGAELDEIEKYIRPLRKRKPLPRIRISNTMSSEMKLMMDNYLRKKRGILLIPCYLEAAVFARFSFEITYRRDASKILNEISQLLSSEETKYKNVVVVANDDDETFDRLNELYNRLLSSCRRPVYKMSSSSFDDVDETLIKFEDDVLDGMGPVMICPDHVLGTLRRKIYNADILIHYNLPPKVTAFRRRFSVLLRRMQELTNKISSSIVTSVSSEKPEVRCFIDEGSIDLSYPQLLRIMTQLHLKSHIPERIESVLSDITDRKERNHPDLCMNLKQFGKCDIERKCQNRHVIVPAKDRPDPSLPATGQVMVQIKKVYSPNHFRVRLLEHKNEKESWKPLPVPNGSIITYKLNKHIEKNGPTAIDGVNVGDLLATEYCNPNSVSATYQRVRVMKILDGKQPKAVLKFVDSGHEATKPLSALCQLPAEFASIPETTVDVFIANLQPIDEDVTWGSLFTRHIDLEVCKWKNQENVTFVGGIELVIGQSMWLNTLQCYVKMKLYNDYFLGDFSIRRYLLSEKLAIKNENHVTVLREKCRNAGLMSSSIPDQSSESQNVSERSDASKDENGNVNGDGNKNNDNPPFKGEDGSSPFKRPDKPAPRKKPTTKNGGRANKPEIWWKQDGTSVTITVNKNIDDFVVTHSGSRKIHFEGTEDKTQYQFDVVLFGKFVDSTFRHYKSASTVLIKFDKSSLEMRWRRLLKSAADEEHWIKEEIEIIDEDDQSQLTEYCSKNGIPSTSFPPDTYRLESDPKPSVRHTPLNSESESDWGEDGLASDSEDV